MIIGLTAQIKKTLPAHDHHLHEFIICLNDNGKLHVPDQEYPFQTGCTFFIPGNIPHSIVATKDHPVLSTFACFDWQSCNEFFHDSLKPLVKRLSSAVSVAYNYEKPSLQRNLVLADQLQKELDKKDSYSQSMAGSILGQLLINHIRDLGYTASNEPSSAEQKIAKSIEWITNHLHRHITIDDMAKRAQMSRSLYSRNFRAYTGMSLIEFTMAARADKAARLLSQSDRSIMDIAFASGFRNIGHFHKTFKKRYRMTPNQYRKTIIKQGLR